MRNDVPSEPSIDKAFGKRILAGFIDLALWVVLFVVAAVAFGTTTTTTQGSTTNTNASLTGIPFLIFCLAELAYFVVLEWQFSGTIGKLLVGIRVVDNKDGRITLKQSLVRNVLRLVDAFPYFIPYLTGLILIAGDKRKRRLGDKLAGTLVVLK